MKSLYIYPIEGLYNELFDPNPKELEEKINISVDTLNVNGYFWAEIFDNNNILKIIDKLRVLSYSGIELEPQFSSVLSNVNNFLSCVNEAKIKICDQGNSEQEFFRYIETINILIALYNRFGEFGDIKLSVQDGYLFDDYSYKNINDKCLIKKFNPYLDLIIKKVIPKIEEYNPDIIFFVGKPSYYNVAIAKILNHKHKNIKLCITRHSSEYYSLSKITAYLQRNQMLFSDFDFVILECFESMEKLLLECLENGGDVSKTPNILFKNRFNEIVKTSQRFFSSETRYNLYTRAYVNNAFRINPCSVADVHIAPYSKCYWNKCSFCGINKKYSHDYQQCEFEDFHNNVNELIKQLKTIKYLWFIDEALTVEQLTIISDCLIENNANVMWQARTRIEKELLSPQLVEKLNKSGLRELRLGLESACIKTLKNMNKFDSDFSLNLVDDVVELFTCNNISIHFPIIIGFPDESDYDRSITYEYLRKISTNNKLVTFNINILNLDVSSTLFRNWFDYAITSPILPCLPEHFIGNIADWEGKKSNYWELEVERNNFMRDILYNWYPKNAITLPVVYYRLMESIRNTLIIKANSTIERLSSFKEEATLVLSDKTIVTYLSHNRFLVYDWNSHHYFRCNSTLLKIILEWKAPMTREQFKKVILTKYKDLITEYDLNILISKFTSEYHFLDIK